MGETAQVPAEWLPIFQHDTLPGHPANRLINHPGQPKVNGIGDPKYSDNEEIDWPVTADGIRFMPMAGRFLVRGPDGGLTAHEDGFLIVGGDGHPAWVAEVPGEVMHRG